VRDLMGAFLAPLGCQIVFAEDGLTALDLVRELRPALVITEMLLPRMDGLTLCRTIKLSPGTSDIPVVVLSVIDAGQRASLAGADAFVLKPLAGDSLLEKIRPLLDRSRQPGASP
jgi:CheY-like chemotaxis protein